MDRREKAKQSFSTMLTDPLLGCYFSPLFPEFILILIIDIPGPMLQTSWREQGYEAHSFWECWNKAHSFWIDISIMLDTEFPSPYWFNILLACNQYVLNLAHCVLGSLSLVEWAESFKKIRSWNWIASSGWKTESSWNQIRHLHYPGTQYKIQVLGQLLILHSTGLRTCPTYFKYTFCGWRYGYFIKPRP